MTTRAATAAIRRLTPGTPVGHANPELADWKGRITANKRGNWARPETGDLWVTWHAGYVPARDGNQGLPAAGWIEATALTIQGTCPDCARPAHYILPGNFWDRTEGWHHDERHDQITCWAGKATYEARQQACDCRTVNDQGGEPRIWPCPVHGEHQARPASEATVYDRDGNAPWETTRMTYPLTSTCTCGQTIEHPGPHNHWAHRLQ